MSGLACWFGLHDWSFQRHANHHSERLCLNCGAWDVSPSWSCEWFPREEWPAIEERRLREHAERQERERAAWAKAARG